MFLIDHDKFTKDRLKDVSYGSIMMDYRPKKEEPNRKILTVGGNLIDYTGDVSTPTEDITTAKPIINSTIFTPRAKYMCCNIINFYLGTPLI